MANISAHTAPHSPNILARIGSAVIGFFDAAMTAKTMAHEVETLQNMPDSELARIGVERGDIVRHVYSKYSHS